MSQASEIDQDEHPSPRRAKSKTSSRKKITPGESKTIAEAFEHYNGDWKRIMTDSRVIQTGRDRVHCENHIMYLKRKKNALLSPPIGKRFREQVSEDLERGQVEDFEAEESIATTQLATEAVSSLPPITWFPPSLSSMDALDRFPSPLTSLTPPRASVDTIPPQLTSLTPPRASVDTIDGVPPPLTSLPPRLASVDAVDRVLLGSAVSSATVTNATEFNSAYERVRSATENRNARIHQRTRDRAGAVEDIRSDRTEARTQRDRHDTISLMMLQLQRDIATDREEREERREKREAELHQLMMHREDLHKKYLEMLMRMSKQMEETRELLLENRAKSNAECVLLVHMCMMCTLLSQVKFILDDMLWQVEEDDATVDLAVAIVRDDIHTSSAFSSIELGLDILSRSRTFGMGKGRGLRQKRRRLNHADVFGRFEGDPIQYEKHIFISGEEFHRLFEVLKPPLESIYFGSRLSLQNILLMGLLFIIQYRGGKTLALLFNCSEAMVSKLISKVLPCIAGNLAFAIPNRLSATSHSTLHPHIRAIIDNTIHKTRKPSSKQYLDYNGHYKVHGRLTQVLIDFDGNIIHIFTMIPGSVNDTLAAVYSEGAKQILGYDRALGDCAFSSIYYAVGGYRNFEVNTPGRQMFDEISRREQVFIENVNKWIKDCRSINRQDVFVHGDHLLFCCIFAVVELYDIKKCWGYFQPSRLM